MIWPPASAESTGDFPPPSPLQGDPAEAAAWADHLRSVGGHLLDYTWQVQFALRTLSGLSGRAVERIGRGLDSDLLPGAALVSGSVGEAERAVRVFAEAAEGWGRRGRGILLRADGRLRTIGATASRVCAMADAIGVTGPSTWREAPQARLPAPGAGSWGSEGMGGAMAARWEAAWALAAVAWQRALDGLAADAAEWRRLQEVRAEAERRVLSALAVTSLGRLLGAAETAAAGAAPFLAFALTGTHHGRGPASRRAAPAGLNAVLGPGALSAAGRAQAWRQLGLGAADVATLPVRQMVAIARATALPAWAREAASLELLHLAISSPAAVHGELGFVGSGIGVAELRADALRVHEAWRAAHDEARLLKGRPPVQLVGLGNHDGALTAAIVFGDLDRATRVGVNVSGMNSGASSIGSDAGGGAALFRAAQAHPGASGVATVTWIGYRAPDATEVNGMARAEAGGRELAAFLDGLRASRGPGEPPIERLSVFAHSYGSTTAAVALQHSGSRVDAFVTYGSAGFPTGVAPGALHADRVFATHAPGDQTAGFGRLGSHPIDPRRLEGVTVLSAEGGDGFLRVSSHDMHTEGVAPSPLNWGGKTGYLTQGTRSAAAMGGILLDGVPR
ncbi:alpha/beta hydrolase [Leucobacter luti]|uniref:alpha/beta hydrolase n=1 Tax=Leucobacter luti TaxID=340320 RepID=UPI003D07F13B